MKYQLCFYTVIALFASCAKSVHTEPPVIVSVISDRSDTNFIARPHVSSINKLFDFPVHAATELIFRYREITDLRLSPVIEYILPNDSVTDALNVMDDIEFRHKKTAKFIRQADSVLQLSGIKHGTPTSGSQCYIAIAKEIEYLSKHNLQSSTLHVYSDLCEFGNGINMYSTTMKLDKASRAKMSQLLLKTYPLPKSLNGLHVRLIYQPRDQISDTRFAFMSQVYRDLLESRSAIVSIASDDNSTTGND